MGGAPGSQNIFQMHAIKLRSRDETGDAEMGTTRQKNKKQKHGSDQKRNFCSNDENLCK